MALGGVHGAGRFFVVHIRIEIVSILPDVLPNTASVQVGRIVRLRFDVLLRDGLLLVDDLLINVLINVLEAPHQVERYAGLLCVVGLVEDLLLSRVVARLALIHEIRRVGAFLAEAACFEIACWLELIVCLIKLIEYFQRCFGDLGDALLAGVGLIYEVVWTVSFLEGEALHLVLHICKAHLEFFVPFSRKEAWILLETEFAL